MSLSAICLLDNVTQSYAWGARESAAGIPLGAPERSYKDDCHKPEILCALTPFWGLNGFRPVPELLALLDEVACAEIAPEAAELRALPTRTGLRRFFRSLLHLPADRRGRLLAELLVTAQERRATRPEYHWIVRISSLYPGDPGVLCVLLLNLVRLSPGEAMFCAAGDLHAYLEGFGVELMANSDNVLRGGLTPKHVDVPALLEILTFADRPVEVLRPVSGRYRTPVDEFELSRVDLTAGERWRSPAERSLEILVNVQGTARISDPSAGSLEIPPGRSVVVPASVEDYELSAPLLLSGRPGAFLTERTPRFEDILREPVGEVDYVLVTDADLAHDRIDWAYPGIARRGAPFLQPVLRLPLRDGHGAWLYRVSPPAAPATPLAKYPAPPPGDSRWIPDGAFVAAEGTELVVRAPAAHQSTRGTVEPFRFVGGNFRALQGERERKLYRETLDAMAEDGLTVGRVWALGEGEPSSSEWQVNHELFRLAPDRFIEESYRHLDRVLAAARQRGIRLIITLANNWSDYGGIPAYLRWAGIPEAQQDGVIFFNDARVRRMYLDGVEKLLSRTNTATGVRYVDDPTIFGWELINEGNSPSVAAQLEWTRDVATYIEQRDPNHMITSGMVNCQSWRDWLQVNSLPQVDYMAVHVYPHETQCSWRCLETVLSTVAEASRTIQKPVILQEFGFPRGAAWDGAAADVATYRMLTMAMRSGFRGALVWAYEPSSDQRQEQFGIIVDRPDPDDRRTALRRRAEELRAGHPEPQPQPQPQPDDRAQLPFAPPPPPEHDGWQASAGGALLEIRPDQYHVATFRRRQGAYYLMTQLTHVYGGGAGRFGYHIGVPRRDAPPKALEIEARISEWEWENRKAPPPGWTSPVRVLLDDQEIARFDAIPDDRLGKVERIRVERPEVLSSMISGRHTLWFEVPDGPDAHGLCIYGPPAIDSGLDPADHPPIRIRLLDAAQD